MPQHRYVHDEVCAVVHLAEAALPGARAALPDLHRGVGDALNGLLAADGGAATAGRRLHHRAPASAGRARPPAILLPRASGPSAALFLYATAPEGQAGPPTAENAAATGALVERLNRRLHGGHALAAHPATVVAAGPNWLSVGAPDWGGSGVGGPGCAPLAVTPARLPGGAAPFHFRVQGASPREEGAAAAAPVVVAVLDARPRREQVARAAARCAAQGLPNALLAEVAADDRVWQPEELSLQPPADFHHLRHLVPNWAHGLERWGRAADEAELAALRQGYYNIADHGLFVTGIIRDLVREAPGVEVRLVRVLDDAGIGDLHGIASVLAELPAALLRGRRPAPGDPQAPKLVVNLSLMLEAPGGDLASDGQGGRQALVRALPEDQRALLEVVAWLGEEWGALVVAAAGNDALGTAPRPEARVPAGYDAGLDFVLGVGAVARRPGDGAPPPAAYSNRSRRGVAVWGGNARLVGAGMPPQVGLLPDGAPDAVAGLFSAERLPFDGGPNETGWAHWSGTSFAAPIVSGLAARRWAAHPSEDAAAVAEYVRGLATAEEAELGCAGILVSQA